MNVYGALVEWYCWGATEVLREKLVPLLSVQYTSHMDGPGTFTAEYQWTKYDRKITEIPTQSWKLSQQQNSFRAYSKVTQYFKDLPLFYQHGSDMTPIGPKFYSFTRLVFVAGHKPMELTCGVRLLCLASRVKLLTYKLQTHWTDIL